MTTTETLTPDTTQSTPPPSDSQSQAPTETQTPSTSASTDLGGESTSATAGDTTTTDLGTDDTPEGEAAATADPYKDFRGPPESGKYEPFTLPDGAVADEELSNEFTPLAAELGLSQAGTQKLVDFKAKLDAVQVKRWGDHLTELKTQAVAAFGGEVNYKTELGFAKQALKKFGTPELVKALNTYGVGAHAEMIRAWAKIGRATGESPGLNSAGGSGVVTEKPLHELMYGDSAKT